MTAKKPKKSKRTKKKKGPVSSGSENKAWRWSNRICSVAGCYTKIGARDFFCKAHQAKPNVRDDGVFAPIPLSRLMGRRA